MEHNEDRDYQLCCSKTKASLLRFLVQIIITFTLMIFCVYQLASGNEEPIYINLILILTGIWLPSPKHE